MPDRTKPPVRVIGLFALGAKVIEFIELAVYQLNLACCSGV